MTEVGVAEFRRDLKAWLERAKSGEELLVTERGAPVARVIGAGRSTSLEQLIAEGVVSPPRSARKPRATGARRVRARGSVSDLIIAERDDRR